jgi:hypothetical protein
MANIVFGILKVVRVAIARELTDGEFYVSSSEMQFLICSQDKCREF